MKILIVDDEELSRIAIRLSLENIPSLKNKLTIEEAHHTKAAEEKIGTFTPDIVLLDIEMPGESGINFLQRLGKVYFETIFITAYHEYAVQAFKQNAMAYILKPIDDEDLKVAILNCMAQLKLRKKAKDYTLLKELIHHLSHKKLAIPTQNGYDFIALENIIYLSAAGSYTEIYVVGLVKPIVISKNIKHVEETLPKNDFIRVHDSKVVNRKHIVKYIKGSGGYLVMINDIIINVSKRKKEFLMQSLLH